MNLLECAKSFVTVAELGSFARAADRLNFSAAAVSRHILYLEAELGERLLQRTTRKVRLTETGQLCLERYVRVFEELDELSDIVQGRRGEPQGTLRVSTTSLFWTRAVAPVLPEFLKRYPQISLHANLTERAVDLVDEGYDLSLQLQRPTGQTFVARSLLTLRRILFASPAYLELRGTPMSQEDLVDHNCLVYAHAAEQVEWRFWNRDGAESRIPVRGSLRSNDLNTLRLAAVAGIGIASGPLFLAKEELEAGQLVQILSHLRSDAPDVWMIYPSRRQLPAKVRCFIDFLQERFGS